MKILFVSVHPDDESFGCGGTILKHKHNNDKIFWLNLTGASLDHPFGFTKERIDERELLIKQIIDEYKFDGFENLNLPTQMLDTVDMRIIIGAIDKVISKWKPEVLYIPNRSDVHSDHRMGFDAVYACTKNFRKPFIEQILMYETLSETEFAPALLENAFIPNVFVDISDFWEKRFAILKMYKSEIMPDPYPRSAHAIKGLASYRGSRIGVKYAEAFTLLFQKR